MDSNIINPATGIINWFLRRTGYQGITMPWRKVYLLPEHMTNQGLIDHEMVHIEQIDRMGALKFTFLYLYYLVIHGYQNHPLEIEARHKSNYF
jgi:hypothetical protein